MRFLPIPEIDAGIIIRLWAGIDDRTPNECWPWKKGRNNDGYGMISVGGEFPKGRMYFVTRVLWKHWFGYDPGEHLVCHECNSPPCCNPRHLFLGTHSENNQHAYDCGRNCQVGELNGNLKISGEDMVVINELLKSNGPTTVAAMFGVTTQAIWNRTK